MAINVYQSIQGNLGLAKAINYFVSHSIPVSIPLNDTQKYDLVADFNGKLQRVSVKTSRNTHTNGKSYEVQLRNTGGSSGKSVIRLFDNESADYLFVYTADDKMYLIPFSAITATSGIVVGTKYTEYLVEEKPFSVFSQEIENR